MRLLSRYANKMTLKQILLSIMKCVPKPVASTTLIVMNRQDTAVITMSSLGWELQEG